LRHVLIATGLFCGLLAGSAAYAREPDPQPPSVIFGALYSAVELGHVFADQKTFADAVPKEAPDTILADYAAQKDAAGFDLRAFVAAHFTPPVLKTVSYNRRKDETVSEYITDLWTLLRRPADEGERYSSLLPLPAPYIVPGGRFSEIYYWDTYFTMLGLEQDGQTELAEDMVRNIAALIQRYGHMPNGNRSYYLSRSQPPFFSCMVDLLSGPKDLKGRAALYATYLPAMQAEEDYWMEGADALEAGKATRNVVRLADGTLLNRYWDERDTPRDESYAEDVATAAATHRPAAEVYRDLRAGAESGWDYSSRWFADGHSLATLHTTEILPVDLNSELFHLESALAYGYRLNDQMAESAKYRDLAAKRAEAIRRLMWDQRAGDFTDYDWVAGKQTGVLSAATLVPLFFHVATTEQARAVATTVAAKLLGPGGLRTTTAATGQQWDAPNGWAPLQWMGIDGLSSYGSEALARQIAGRWETRVVAGFANDGVLVEKYNVDTEEVAKRAGGGEYKLQVGFGWTNGVLAALLARYPVASPDTTPAKQ
jgi:alpha,alpha-trehalase